MIFIICLIVVIIVILMIKSIKKTPGQINDSLNNIKKSQEERVKYKEVNQRLKAERQEIIEAKRQKKAEKAKNKSKQSI